MRLAISTIPRFKIAKRVPAKPERARPAARLSALCRYSHGSRLAGECAICASPCRPHLHLKQNAAYEASDPPKSRRVPWSGPAAQKAGDQARDVALDLAAFLFRHNLDADHIPQHPDAQQDCRDKRSVPCRYSCPFANKQRYEVFGDQIVQNPRGIGTALLHKSGEGRRSPFPGQTRPLACATGVPSAVKLSSTAKRTWNSTA